MTAPAMPYELTEETLCNLVAAIVDEVDPELILLFGSLARGEGHPESDLDLLIVEAEDFGPARSRIREAGRLYRRLAGLGRAKDIVLVSQNEFEHWRDSLNHVVARAWQEGIVLHERP